MNSLYYKNCVPPAAPVKAMVSESWLRGKPGRSVLESSYHTWAKDACSLPTRFTVLTAPKDAKFPRGPETVPEVLVVAQILEC